MTVYKPIQIANCFLEKFASQSGGISHMKLQKLVYCVHGWWLTQDNADPILQESPEVWRFGPVFPSLYHELKVYGTEQITTPVKPSPFDTTIPTVNDDETKQLIDWVWQRYGHLSAMALSDMTHREGSAWRDIAKKHNFRVPLGLEIDSQSVREEFNAVKKEFADNN